MSKKKKKKSLVLHNNKPLKATPRPIDPAKIFAQSGVVTEISEADYVKGLSVGISASKLNWLFNQFSYYISNTIQSEVKSVNDLFPDASGNVELTAENIDEVIGTIGVLTAGMLPKISHKSNYIEDGYHAGSDANDLAQVGESGQLPAKIIPAMPISESKVFGFDYGTSDAVIWAYIVAHWEDRGFPAPTGGAVAFVNMKIEDGEEYLLHEIWTFTNQGDWKQKTNWIERVIEDNIVYSWIGHTHNISAQTVENEIKKFGTITNIQSQLATDTQDIADIKAQYVKTASLQALVSGNTTVKANDVRSKANESGVATNKADIAKNTANNTTNKADIAKNTANNTANKADIAKNTAKVGIPTGGTTGQSLVKKTDTDGDVEWKNGGMVPTKMTIFQGGASPKMYSSATYMQNEGVFCNGRYSDSNYGDFYPCYAIFTKKSDEPVIAHRWYSVKILPEKAVWLEMNLGNIKSHNPVTQYKIACQAGYNPYTWEFQGSDDETSWKTLDTQEAYKGWVQGEVKTFKFSNTIEYQYYRLYVTKAGTTGTKSALILWHMRILDKNNKMVMPYLSGHSAPWTAVSYTPKTECVIRAIGGGASSVGVSDWQQGGGGGAIESYSVPKTLAITVGYGGSYYYSKRNGSSSSVSTIGTAGGAKAAVKREYLVGKATLTSTAYGIVGDGNTIRSYTIASCGLSFGKSVQLESVPGANVELRQPNILTFPGNGGIYSSSHTYVASTGGAGMVMILEIDHSTHAESQDVENQEVEEIKLKKEGNRYAIQVVEDNENFMVGEIIDYNPEGIWDEKVCFELPEHADMNSLYSNGNFTTPAPENSEFYTYDWDKQIWILNESKKDNLISVISDKVKDQTENNISTGLWLDEGEEVEFTSTYEHLRFINISDAKSFITSLKTKTMEELIELLSEKTIKY